MAATWDDMRNTNRLRARSGQGEFGVVVVVVIVRKRKKGPVLGVTGWGRDPVGGTQDWHDGFYGTGNVAS